MLEQQQQQQQQQQPSASHAIIPGTVYSKESTADHVTAPHRTTGQGTHRTAGQVTAPCGASLRC